MVFSDTGDAHGGFYDANNGLDYHVPVAGGAVAPRPLDVVHVSVEMAPIAKARRARRAPRGCIFLFSPVLPPPRKGGKGVNGRATGAAGCSAASVALPPSDPQTHCVAPECWNAGAQRLQTSLAERVE